VAFEYSAQSPSLQIRILGPLIISRGTKRLIAGAAGPRTVLALLALAGGALVHRESLIDGLWGARPPETAVGILQSYVSRLRALLDFADGGTRQRCLVRDGRGYRLRVAPEELDLLAFRQLAARARQERAAGAAEAACAGYEGALGLWRGDPLADLGALRGHQTVTALAEERLTLATEYADLASEYGWHDKVVAHLRPLAAQAPLDECTNARLMIALAGSGKRAAALELYDDVRRRLDEQLGVGPSHELRAAHLRVLRQDTAPSSRSLSPWRSPFLLPAAPVNFTGRTAQRERIASMMSGSGVPLVVISGPPGSGKTALALRAAHGLLGQFPDGQLWAELAGDSDSPREAGDVLAELLRALGTTEAEIPDGYVQRVYRFRSRLAGRKVLVLADGAASAAQVLPLLPGMPGSALIVTSRTRLADLTGAQLLPLDVMSEADAADMLSQIIGSARAAADPAAIRGIVGACGALPLALRIAGAKLAARPTWPLSAMARRLNQPGRRLDELRSGTLSVRAAVARSYCQLSDRARGTLRLLALLGRGDFAEWVIAVLLGTCPGIQDAACVLDELMDNCLLAPVGVDRTGEPRYRVPELIRDYARERLAEEPPETVTAPALRLLESWRQLTAQAVGRDRAGHVTAAEARRLTADRAAWFNAERANLESAARCARRYGLAGLADEIADCSAPGR
jgi:DNA-binding SARP family transcriptional activator